MPGSWPWSGIFRGTGVKAWSWPEKGSPPEVHALAHAMNHRLGNVDSTVIYTQPVDTGPADQMESLQELVSDIDAGGVELLLILGGNPVYMPRRTSDSRNTSQK